MRALLLSLCAFVLSGQAAVLVDLQGPWRYTSQPCTLRCAAPDYDDRAWDGITLRPGVGRPPNGWARRRVDLPSDAAREALALTFGTFWRAYEVYVEGERVGTTGGFPSGWNMEVPRTRTFAIPPALTAGKRSVLIAVRFRNARRPLNLQVPDDGYYVLATASAVPADLGLQSLSKHRLAQSSEIAFGTMFFVIGLLSVLAWRADQSRREFLWFALVCIVRGVHIFYGLAVLAPGAHPFNKTGLAAMNAVNAELEHPLYLEFVMAALGTGWTWVRPVAWVGYLYVAYRVYFESGLLDGLAYSMLVGAFSLVLIAVYVWRRGRPAGLPDLAFLLLLGLPPLHNLEAWSVTVFGVGLGFAQVYRIGEYIVSRESLALVLVCGAIFALLVRSVATDRRERQRLAGEMEAAKQMQQFLLGAATGSAEVVYEPAEEVGGDFYFTAGLEGGGQLVVVGDVSGKGLKAAFIVSMVMGAIRNRRTDEPGGLLAELNRVVCGGTGFVTAIAARVASTGHVILANAGNPAPYVAGREIELPHSLPLGLDSGARYEELELTLIPGDSLTFVSDGVVEAENAQRELFGFDRTREISTQSAQEIADAAKAWGQNDDITVVTVRRRS